MITKRERVRRRYQSLRAAAGLSQYDMAHLLKIGRDRYWRIENGVVEPTQAERLQLTKILGRNLDEALAS